MLMRSKKKEGEKWVADDKIQLQNLKLVSFAWNICSVGAKGMFRKGGIGCCWCKADW